MAVQMGDYNKIKYINLTMDEIHLMTDDIYDSLMDEDSSVLKTALRELVLFIKDMEKKHAYDKRTA